LERLDLSNNAIRSVARAFSGLSTLYALDLGGNFLTTIPDVAFTCDENLTMLRLGKQVTHISTRAFSGLPRLQHLSLDNNQLEIFPIGSITFLSGLTVLDISNNHLRNIVPTQLATMSKLTSLNLQGNGCLTDGGKAELGAWLNTVSPGWNDGCST
jgi:Leucine-rich repeat (LRR) protein